MTKPQTETLKSKQHFEILDGLREVAALAIAQNLQLSQYSLH
ncbi:hypothetical protein [Flavobacterium sp. FlaQc-48]